MNISYDSFPMSFQESEEEHQFTSVDDSVSSSFKGWSTGSTSPGGTEEGEIIKAANVVEIQL